MTFFFTFVKVLCHALTVAIIIRAAMSWFSPSPVNMLYVVLYRITEPVLSPLRRITPMVGMFDLTPLLAILILQMIASFVP